MNRGQKMLIEWKGERSLHEISYDLRITVEGLRKYCNGSPPGRPNALKLREAVGIPVDAWDETVTE